MGFWDLGVHGREALGWEFGCPQLIVGVGWDVQDIQVEFCFVTFPALHNVNAAFFQSR